MCGLITRRFVPHLIDLGKVLAGVQVPAADEELFNTFLKKLDYAYVEETDNPVYRRFLSV